MSSSITGAPVRGAPNFTVAKATGDVSTFFGMTSGNPWMGRVLAVVLTMIVVYVMFVVGSRVVYWLLTPSSTVHLLDGMVAGNQQVVFPQDPSKPTTIYRSQDESSGLEFSWSTWLFLDSNTRDHAQFQHIFSKGNQEIDSNGVVLPSNAPGLYLAPHSNTLVVFMNTYAAMQEKIEVPNVPMNKWVHVLVRCRGQMLDVYINGTVSRSVDLGAVPKQNNGEVSIGLNGGFDGYVSNLWYFPYDISLAAIQALVSAGPNTSLVHSTSALFSASSTNYLSYRWFTGGAM